MELKMKSFIVYFTIFLMIGLSVEAADALRISNVRISNITTNTSTVSWTTDGNSDSTVYSGVNRPPVTKSQDTTYTKNHSITLKNLFANRQYFVIVQSRNTTESKIDDNSSYTYTFLTQRSLSDVNTSLTTSIPTGVNAQTASFVNKSIITINGTSLTGTTVRFFINSETIPSQIEETGKYSLVVGINGTFSATLQLFETVHSGIIGYNVIKIMFIGPAGDKQTVERTVIVDTKPPIIYIENINSPTRFSSLNLNGSVSEPSNVTVSIDQSSGEILALNSILGFGKAVSLGGDGRHNITLTAVDKAGNSAVLKTSLVLDTTPCEIKFYEKIFQEKQRFSIINVNGTTSEPDCKITVRNLGRDLQPRYTNTTSLNTPVSRGQVNQTKYPYQDTTSLSTEYEIGVGGLAIRYEKTFESDSDGKFKEFLAIAEGRNRLIFNVSDKAGNVRSVERFIEFEPGSKLWKIGKITTVPNEVYTSEITNPDVDGTDVSVMYDVYYYGPSDMEITNIRASASLDGDKVDNKLFSVRESYAYYDAKTKKAFILTKIKVNRYSGKIEDLPDQLNFAMRTVVNYNYGTISMNEEVFFQSGVAVEKPFKYTKWLSPEMINKTIKMLDEWIIWLEQAQKVTEVAMIATTAACVAYTVYTYIGGLSASNEKNLYTICDRVWCPTIPPHCDRMNWNEDLNQYEFQKDGSTFSLKKIPISSVPIDKRPAGCQNEVLLLTSSSSDVGFGWPGVKNLQAVTGANYVCADDPEVSQSFENQDIPPYLGKGCYQEGAPNYDDTKCLFGAGEVSKYGKVNPYDDMWLSVQCGCISGVYGHITNWLRIVQGFKKCLQQAYIGEIRGGYCERLFAQFVCDLISWALKRIIERGGSGGFMGASGDEAADVVRGNFNTVTQKLKERYGAIAQSRLGLDSAQIVHKFCVAAITGDWSDLRNLLTQAARVPVAPVVGPMFPESRFAAWNPFTGQASITYYATLGILSGGQRVNGNVKIICDKSKPDGNYCPAGAPVTIYEETLFVEADGSMERNIAKRDENARYWGNVMIMHLEYQLGEESMKYDKEEQILHKGGIIAQCHFQLIPCCLQCDLLAGQSFGSMQFMSALFTPKNNNIYYPGNKVFVKINTQKMTPMQTTTNTSTETKPSIYAVWNLLRPDKQNETGLWPILWNEKENDVFELLTLPAAGQIGVSRGFEWKADGVNIKKDGTAIPFETGDIFRVYSQSKVTSVTAGTTYVPREITQLKIEGVDVTSSDSMFECNGLGKALLSCTFRGKPDEEIGEGTFSQISIAARGDKDDTNLELKFDWTSSIIGSGTDTALLGKERLTQPVSETSTTKYTPGTYLLNVTLWHDVDNNGIINENDKPVVYGQQLRQSKILSFEFRAKASDICAEAPKVEIVYPTKDSYVTSTLKRYPNQEGVEVYLWDDCNDIANVALYDRKGFDIGKEQDLTAKKGEPYPIALSVQNGNAFWITNLGTGSQIPDATRYANDEKFELIVRAYDKQKHVGEDRVIVTYTTTAEKTQTQVQAAGQEFLQGASPSQTTGK